MFHPQDYSVNLEFKSEESRSASSYDMVHSTQTHVNLTLLRQWLRKAGPRGSHRLYQIWPGNNRFLFQGKLMLGPSTDLKAYFSLWLLLLFAFILQNILIHNLQGYFTLYVFCLVVNSFIESSMVVYFVLVTTTEPGIVPRKIIADLVTPTKPSFLPSFQTRLRMCAICQIKQHPKTVHCDVCGNCVEYWNYHGSIFNNCIGKGNQHYYVLFLVASIQHIIQSVLSLVVYLMVEYSEYYNMVQDRRTPTQEHHNIYLAYMILIGIPALLLLAISAFLIINKLNRDTRTPSSLFSPDCLITVDSIQTLIHSYLGKP